MTGPEEGRAILDQIDQILHHCAALDTRQANLFEVLSRDLHVNECYRLVEMMNDKLMAAGLYEMASNSILIHLREYADHKEARHNYLFSATAALLSFKSSIEFRYRLSR